ncbi:MAG TPA: metal-dependent hydrolase, partial [Vicinamibacterales bacterium]|nr:metal-dependent hydrolase [Vicinamibacterales bacterium]
LVIASNLPDVDVLVFATDTPSVSFRRGWTHGVGAQILLPIVFTGVLWLVGRRRARAGDGSPPLRAGWLLALSYLGVYSHVFLDYLNTYGVRLLTPLDWRWFYGDAVFIIDPVLWVVLGAGVSLARRGRRLMPSRVALVIATCYIAAMLIAAGSARAAVEDDWASVHGAPPQGLMVGPRPLSLARDVIIDTGSHYEWGTFTWPSSVTFTDRVPKNDDRPEVAVAREAPNVHGFLTWSRFPFWQVESVEGGTRVTVYDARFVGRGRLFAASTIVARKAE